LAFPLLRRIPVGAESGAARASELWPTAIRTRIDAQNSMVYSRSDDGPPLN
jgi:hypothetical protein